LSKETSIEPRFIVGIDLGTTHCVVAYTAIDVPEDETPEVKLLSIPQVTNASEVDKDNLPFPGMQR